MSSTEEPVYYIDNDQTVPIYLHIFITLVVFCILCVSLEQTCSLSLNHELFRKRVGVLLSNFSFLTVSIALNLNFAREQGQISFLASTFVLVVRTLQVLYLFIAFAIGYYFVTDSIESAYYKSASVASNDSNVMRTPSWLSRVWLCCTAGMELLLFLGWVIAFVTQDVVYMHGLWICAFAVSIVGAVLVIFALIDIYKYVRLRTKLQAYAQSMDELKLQRLRRFLAIMIFMCTLAICGAIYNLTLLIQHIVRLNAAHDVFREKSLQSSPIDNTGDYLSYMAMLIAVEIAFIFWTYKTNSVNYFRFACCRGYQSYTQHAFLVDKSTPCYVCCRVCIEGAESKRVERMREASAQSSAHPPPQAQEQQAHAQPTQEQQMTLHLRQNTDTLQTQQTEPLRCFSVTGPPPSQHIHVDEESSMAQSSAAAIVDIGNTRTPYKVLVFEFDGCVTADTRRYFEHWTRNDCEALSLDHLISNVLRSEERLQALQALFANCGQRNLKIYCAGHESTSKLQVVLRKMELRDYFETGCIVGSDHHALIDSGAAVSDHTQMKLVVLSIIKQEHIENEQLLLVTAKQETIEMCKQINLCSVVEVKSVDDLSKLAQMEH